MGENRVIIITGTRKGLGNKLALRYLEQGHNVVGCSRGKASLKQDNYMHFELDVSDEREVIRLVRSVKSKFGRIDVLINNAGSASMNHLLTSPYKRAREIFETNFFGTFLFSREVSKAMIKSGKGSIVNFTTVAVPLNLEGEAIYAASKSSVEALTRIAAKELGEFGIRVNAIGPTPIKTDLIKAVPSEKLDDLIGHQAIKRFGEHRDVSHVVDFLIDEHSDFITGQILYLGGVV